MKSLIKILAVSLLLSSCAIEGDVYYEDRYYDPPPWAVDYHAGIFYYYFPNYGMYYYVPADQWIYYNGVYWVYSYSPPYWCSNVNFVHTYRVPMTYAGPRPYQYHHQHVSNYPPRNLDIYYGPRRSLPANLQDKVPARDEKIRKEPVRSKDAVTPRNDIRRQQKAVPQQTPSRKRESIQPPKRVKQPPKRVTPPPKRYQQQPRAKPMPSPRMKDKNQPRKRLQ